jgi:hypothetical protein
MHVWVWINPPPELLAEGRGLIASMAANQARMLQLMTLANWASVKVLAAKNRADLEAMYVFLAALWFRDPEGMEPWQTDAVRQLSRDCDCSELFEWIVRKTSSLVNGLARGSTGLQRLLERIPAPARASRLN